MCVFVVFLNTVSPLLSEVSDNAFHKRKKSLLLLGLLILCFCVPTLRILWGVQQSFLDTNFRLKILFEVQGVWGVGFQGQRNYPQGSILGYPLPPRIVSDPLVPGPLLR